MDLSSIKQRTSDLVEVINYQKFCPGLVEDHCRSRLSGSAEHPRRNMWYPRMLPKLRFGKGLMQRRGQQATELGNWPFSKPYQSPIPLPSFQTLFFLRRVAFARVSDDLYILQPANMPGLRWRELRFGTSIFKFSKFSFLPLSWCIEPFQRLSWFRILFYFYWRHGLSRHFRVFLLMEVMRM